MPSAAYVAPAPPDVVEKDGHLKKGSVLARVQGELDSLERRLEYLRGSASMAELSVEAAHELVANGEAFGGMAVKLKAAMSAVQAGVSSVRIGNLETLVSASAGTVLRGSLEAVA